jgi:hypothetical protein
MSKIVHMPVPVLAEHKPRGHRGTMITWARVDVPVRVGGISADEAPVACVVHGAEGVEIAFRSHGGELWRPLLTGGGKLGVVAGSLAEVAASALDDEFTLACDGRVWDDNPFGVALAARFSDKRGVHMTSLPLLSTLHRVVSHDARAVSEEAARIAAEEVVEIDGVLHRRTVPPCWGVGVNANIPFHDGSLGVVLPDLLPGEVMAFMPPDDPEGAVALQELLKETNRRISEDMGWTYDPRVTAREARGSIRIVGDLPAADHVGLTLDAFRDRVETAFSTVKMGEIPLGLVAFRVDLERALAARREGRPDAPSDLETVATADQALKAMTVEHWNWHRVAQPMFESRFQRRRAEFQARLDADRADDIDAILTISPR